MSDKYPYKSDIPSLMQTLHDESNIYNAATDKKFPAEINAMNSATSFAEVKIATKNFQTAIYEDLPMIPMFKYTHRHVFFKTMVPYEKVYFGTFHGSNTWGGFSSIVKVY
jgi:ABC-type oligopeptide transport system substrate-binding subunit